MEKHRGLLATIVCMLAFASVLALAGCGGSGGSGTDAAPTEKPDVETTDTTAADTTATDATAQDATAPDATAQDATAQDAVATESAGDSNAEPVLAGPAYDENECMLIALGDAGVAVDGCMITETEIEKENGRTIYSIEFYTDDLEYEYAIDMDTGQIIAAESEPR